MDGRVDGWMGKKWNAIDVQFLMEEKDISVKRKTGGIVHKGKG